MRQQLFMALPFNFIVLKTLRQKENAFKRQNIFTCIPQIVATNFDFVLKLRSILGMKWCLRVE